TMKVQNSDLPVASATDGPAGVRDTGWLELPTDVARPTGAAAASAVDVVRFALEAPVAGAIRELARASGCGVRPVLGLAWMLVLSRLGGQDHFTITVRDGGPASPARALRADLRGDPSRDDLLARLDAVLRTADAGGAPDTGDAVPPAGLGFDGARPSERDGELFLSFDAPDAQDGRIDATLHFSTALFARATAERWAGYVRTVLAALPAHGAQPLDALPMIGAAEQRLIDGFNATAPATAGVYVDATAASPTGDLIHAMVEAQAERTPDAVAATLGDDSLRYAELDARADRLAARLRALGVGADVPVALYVERSLAMVVGLLAVLKAGGAYVPLDPSHPRDRTAAVLAGARPAVILTQASLRDVLPAEGDTAVVLLDADFAAFDPAAPAAADAAPATAVAPHHLAYVILTSGSTGAPKGVAMHHGALANLLRWQAAHPRVAAPQRTLQFAALGFDVAFQEIFATLAVGGTLVLIDEAVRRDPQALAAVMRAQRVQRLYLPFIALQNIAEYMVAADEALPDLQDVMTAGEQLHASPAVRAFFARLPGCRLHNQYGPTESHVVTALELPADPSTWAALPSIGRPIDHCLIHVLDARGRTAPLGVAGEIHIGGAGVARGYLHRPELTAERFVADPFSTDPAARLYRTGDIGRWRADGEIDCLGRNDSQVKVRGFRVELGEIEGALLTHPAVSEAAVLARHDRGGDARLVAYVTAQPGASADDASLRAHLAALLPPYMVPAVFVALATLPRSPNGKIDRRALPAPLATRPDLGASFEEGRSDTERLVCAAFARVLGLDRAGRADNFFDLGCDSLP
ncbi:MAG TPA: amino acid adenylation domain-containing protein, partial [Variovorax sp.]|nr:amino acid adenylation domain-containing protein [Variovorax sp.]